MEIFSVGAVDVCTHPVDGVIVFPSHFRVGEVIDAVFFIEGSGFGGVFAVTVFGHHDSGFFHKATHVVCIRRVGNKFSDVYHRGDSFLSRSVERQVVFAVVIAEHVGIVHSFIVPGSFGVDGICIIV